MIGPSFFNFYAPISWRNCSQRELKLIYRNLSVYSTERCKVSILCKLNKIKILRKDLSMFLCTCRNGLLRIAPWEMHAYVKYLDWIETPGTHPTPLTKMGGRHCIDPTFITVKFEVYLQIESCYQKYLSAVDQQNETAQQQALSTMFDLMYPAKGFFQRHRKADKYLMVSMIIWFTQIKSLFQKQFPNLFSASDTNDQHTVFSQKQVISLIDAQIRALTGGDVSKETEIFNTTTWRALTELEAKVVESRDLKKKL